MSRLRLEKIASLDAENWVSVADLQALPQRQGDLEQAQDDLEQEFDGFADTSVRQNSPTGAANLPVGETDDRPAEPANGMFRYNKELDQFEGFQNGTWGQVGGGLPVMSVLWWPNRDSIPAGYVALDGQELSRATYPSALAQLLVWEADSSPLVTSELLWDTDPTNRGKFTLGDTTSTFRLPDYNGMSVGSLGAVYLTGDGEKSAGTAGVIRQDEMQRITGTLFTSTHAGSGSSEGAFRVQGSDSGIGGVSSFNTAAPKSYTFDSADSPDARTNTYTHGTDVSGVWVIKLFGAVVNVGSADAAQLASDYANLAGIVSQKLDANDALGGAGQTWQDVAASRSLNVTYTNSTGKPIMVLWTGGLSSNAPSGAYINESLVAQQSQSANNIGWFFSFIVPDGATYRIHANSISLWWELR